MQTELCISVDPVHAIIDSEQHLTLWRVQLHACSSDRINEESLYLGTLPSVHVSDGMLDMGLCEGCLAATHSHNDGSVNRS